MISPSINTKYVVTSNLNNLCINKDTVDVNVIPTPQFNLGVDTVTCINNSLILNTHLTSLPTNNYNIKWLPSTYLSNDTIQTPLCTPTNDVTYIVKINSKSLYRCANYDTINVKVLKGFKLLTPDTAICAGNSINMNVQGDSRYAYSWYPTINVSDPNIMAPIILPDTSRLYTVKATKTGCKDSINTIYIDVQPNPIVYVGPDRNICFGDTIQLNPLITPSSYPYYSYSWSPIGSLSNPNIKQPVFAGLITKLVKLVVSTPAKCNGSDDAQFTVVPSNFLDTFIVKPLCPLDSVKILHPFVSQLNWIHWYPNLYIDSVDSETPTVWPTDNFTYLVVAQEVTGCIDSTLVNVEIKNQANLILPDTITLFPGDSYQFNPGGNCLYFSWLPWNGLDNPNISSPTTIVQSSIIYTVDAKTEFGCKTTDSVVVVVEDDSEIDVANAFTPGSEPNSIIKVQHHGIAKLGHFRIFNRWGQVVFETTNIDEGWDGTFNGVPQNIGVYIYTAEAYSYRGKRFYKQGNITLLR
jgi:gliding motility-associated-like protein